MNIEFIDTPILAGQLIKSPGKLNAICGKNSSGKSTVLTSIFLKQIELSLPLAEHLDEIPLQIATEYVSGSASGTKDNVVRQISTLIEGLLASGDHVTAETKERLSKAIIQAAQSQGDIVSANSPEIMKRIFRDKPSQPTTILVPAKRSLLDQSRLTPQAVSNFDGSLVLDRLFILKSNLKDEAGTGRYKEIQEAFSDITEGFVFDISLSDSSMLELLFGLAGSKLSLASEFGLGLRDILIILFAATEPSTSWVLIEEPENHLHPNLQRRLLRFLRSTAKTYFFATHSSTLLDPAYTDQVYLCRFDSGQIRISNEESKWAILNDLGYSLADNIATDILLMVEGPTDREAISEILTKLPVQTQQVAIWCLGGDIMDRQPISVISANFRVFVLLDRELNSGSRRIRAKVQEQCQECGVPLHILDRYAIENYFSLAAYRSVYPFEQSLNDITAISPDRKVDKQIGFNPKSQTRQLARYTTLEALHGSDLLQVLERVATGYF